MKRKYGKILLTVLLVSGILNACACSPAFCDWYRLHIYRRIADGYGHLTDLLPFSLGEILMYAFAAMTVLMILVCLKTVLCCALRRIRARKKRKQDAETGPDADPKSAKSPGRRGAGSFRFLYGKIFIMTAAAVLLVYTICWIIPLRASEISFDVAEDRVYSVQELEDLRTFMVTHLNAAAEEVQRDEDGHVVYVSGSELDEAVAAAMDQLGQEEFPLLCGFYPKNKTAYCSAALKWMGIGGFTYPYTMELTTNRYITGLYMPMLLAHEESHHKGYYLESEANYLAYRALSASSDARLSYAAYENMYYYVNSAYVKSLRQTLSDEELTAYYKTQTQRSDLVKADEAYAEQQVEQDYQSNVNATAEKTLAPAAEKAADKGWAVQAQALGDACYDGVVEMLLKYYYK